MNSSLLSIYVLMGWIENNEEPTPNLDLEGYDRTFEKMCPREEFENRFILKEICSIETLKDLMIKEYLNKKNKEE